MNLRRDVFQAIADPTRRSILLLVASQTMTASAIAANFDSARPTVSKHLQILTECELLQYQQVGREKYQLNLEKMKDIADFIEPFRQLWDARFNSLENLMKNQKSLSHGIKNKSKGRSRQPGNFITRHFDLPVHLVFQSLYRSTTPGAVDEYKSNTPRK